MVVRVDAAPINPSDVGELLGPADLKTLKTNGPVERPVTTAAAAGLTNPLTALGMLDTMRLEGHTALVHTAAASNLGQMLNKRCLADGVQLVNIVRSAEQEAILEAIGAPHIVNSAAPDFLELLTAAVSTTGATLAFDAVGGGPLAGQILSAMESALVAKATRIDQYGSRVQKQVYTYGHLDRSPTIIPGTLGMAWGVGGWLLFSHLTRIGPEATQKLRERVTNEITTTFASSFTREISLAEALDPETIRSYSRMATGEKYLLVRFERIVLGMRYGLQLVAPMLLAAYRGFRRRRHRGARSTSLGERPNSRR
jgi:NADPH2:quinone reductase